MDSRNQARTRGVASRTRRAALVALLAGVFLTELLALEAQESAEPAPYDAPASALLLEVDDAIGPATSDYVQRGIAKAAEERAGLVIITMDTPGGLDSAMRDIITAIVNSPVPVATFVYPSSSRAASAGTYILYASHIAAMAPATNLGAATPVAIGAPSAPSAPRPKSPAPVPETDGEETADETVEPPASEPSQPGTASERKALNDAIAYIRGLAEERGRNAEWAEDAVRDAASLTAYAALEANVIDIVARDIPDLLRQIDGRTVSLVTGEVTLATEGMVLTRYDADWRTKLLATLTNPNVAYLLMLIGIYGLIFEGYNPGAIVPGVVGAIALLLALYAFQVLSVDYAGLALIALGLVLMVSEVFVPSFGALGIGGIVAFVFGSIILLDTDVPGFGVPLGLIGSVAFVGGSLVMAIVWLAVRARRRPVVSGRESLLNDQAIAIADFAEHGTVRIQGELWDAQTRTPVREGQRLHVRAVDGLRLEVEPWKETE